MPSHHFKKVQLFVDNWTIKEQFLNWIVLKIETWSFNDLAMFVEFLQGIMQWKVKLMRSLQQLQSFDSFSFTSFQQTNEEWNPSNKITNYLEENGTWNMWNSNLSKSLKES